MLIGEVADVLTTSLLAAAGHGAVHVREIAMATAIERIRPD